MSRDPISSTINKSPENSFLGSLKQRTQPLHQALEQTEMSRVLMSPTLDRETYVRVLYGFYGAFSPLETILTESMTLVGTNELEGLIDLRTPLAVEDIRGLTGTFDASLLSSAPYPPAIHSIPAALGVLYVLEGSKLGGKVISRQLCQTIGVTPAEGGRFFASTEGLGIEGWRLFRTACATYAENHPEHTETIIGVANDTFGYLHDYFVHYYSTRD